MAVVAAEMLVVHVGMPYGLVCSVLQKERQRYIKPMCASMMGSRSRVGLRSANLLHHYIPKLFTTVSYCMNE